jgi:hypothetical protein
MSIDLTPALFDASEILNIYCHIFLQLFAYDTVNKNLSSKPGEKPKLPVPASLIAGACAGVSSTICTYPLELLKTRLTIQVYTCKTKQAQKFPYLSFCKI